MGKIRHSAWHVLSLRCSLDLQRYVVARMSLQLREEANVIHIHMVCQVTKFSESMRSLAHEVTGSISGSRTKPLHSDAEMQPEKEMEKGQSMRREDSRKGWCPWTISTGVTGNCKKCHRDIKL